MKNCITHLLLSVLIICFVTLTARAQLSPFTKANQDGSLYLSCFWKNDSPEARKGIIYLTDNGSKFEWKAEGQFWHIMAGFNESEVFATSASGKHFEQSFDYGKTFTGNSFEYEGSLLPGYHPQQFILYQPDFTTWPFSGRLLMSQNAGQSFDTINTTLPYFFYTATGKNNGSLYGLMDYWFMYSPDFGVTIDTTKLDERMFPNYYCHTRVVPGAGDGEIYLVGWDFGIKYLIYRSTDYGKTFNKVYTSDSIHPYHINNVYFTAGHQAGEFYTAFDRPDSIPDLHSVLIIGHSTDGAQTFTFNTHDLSSFSSSVDNTPAMNSDSEWSFYPNPSSGYVYINPGNNTKSKIHMTLRDISGRVIQSITIQGSSTIAEPYHMVFPSAINDGLYFLQDERGKTKKLLIRRK